MSDAARNATLAERLRVIAFSLRRMYYAHPHPYADECEEAADELERLADVEEARDRAMTSALADRDALRAVEERAERLETRIRELAPLFGVPDGGSLLPVVDIPPEKKRDALNKQVEWLEEALAIAHKFCREGREVAELSNAYDRIVIARDRALAADSPEENNKPATLAESTRHPHEPEIPPILDDEGRCRICGLLAELDRLAAVEERAGRLEALLDRWHDPAYWRRVLAADSPAAKEGK